MGEEEGRAVAAKGVVAIDEVRDEEEKGDEVGLGGTNGLGKIDAEELGKVVEEEVVVNAIDAEMETDATQVSMRSFELAGASPTYIVPVAEIENDPVYGVLNFAFDPMPSMYPAPAPPASTVITPSGVTRLIA